MGCPKKRICAGQKWNACENSYSPHPNGRKKVVPENACPLELSVRRDNLFNFLNPIIRHVANGLPRKRICLGQKLNACENAYSPHPHGREKVVPENACPFELSVRRDNFFNFLNPIIRHVANGLPRRAHTHPHLAFEQAFIFGKTHRPSWDT